MHATENDGSCIAVVEGCINTGAYNYDSSANTDDGTCCYIAGCTDSTAFNYNSNACFDDGSCIAISLGCTDSSALNYDVSANTDDGTCCYIGGCMDPTAFNYSSNACYDNGTCIAVVEVVQTHRHLTIIQRQIRMMARVLHILMVVQIQRHLIMILRANTDNGSCIPFIYGCIDSAAFNYDSSANTDDSHVIIILAVQINSI